jgi:hypothetical protein
MSIQPAVPPVCHANDGAVTLVIAPREKDLGELTVRRVLPAPERRMVGPFVFFDHMGPADFGPGQGIDVRPHPHIGLSTVTFLFEGEILHRDSLGCVQPIRPGAINLMTAGRGIVHSERTSEALRASGQRLHGIQTWMALPDGREEIDPAFVHVPAGELPEFGGDGARGRVILGAARGLRSPVETEADTLYLHVELDAGGAFALPEGVPEMAVYAVEGEVTVDGCRLSPATMGVLAPGRHATVRAEAPARIMVCGGEPIGRRHVDWNFVSSSAERIERARRDWAEGRFPAVPGDDEFIPLPERSGESGGRR